MSTDGARTLRRVLIFVGLTLGLACLVALLIWLTGGLEDSRILVPGTPVTVAAVLLPTAYMFSPAAANVLTRVLTAEGFAGLWLQPNLRGRWRVWLLAWLLPPTLIAAGALTYFALFPAGFDVGLSGIHNQLSSVQGLTGQPVRVPAEVALLVTILAAVTVAPVLNAVVACGEEFGWRGYLQPKLRELTGPRRAIVATGVIWGCWHWPLIGMGYEYGTGYWGSPWSGPLLFCCFTVVASVLLGWLTVVSGNIWPAALAHGAINASAALPAVVTVGTPNLLLGPLPFGALAMLPSALVAVATLLRTGDPKVEMNS